MNDLLKGFMENLPDKSRFPGGKPPRRPTEMVEKDKGDAGWDAKPVIKKLKGVDTEFFTIKALGDALGGRSAVTIRSWEDKGWLPYSKYRTPAPKNHKVGRRLYTRHQIEVVVDAAARTGVVDPDVYRPDWPQFTKIVVDGWKKTS